MYNNNNKSTHTRTYTHLSGERKRKLLVHIKTYMRGNNVREVIKFSYIMRGKRVKRKEKK